MITTILYILLVLILLSHVYVRMNKQWGFILLFASGIILVVLCYYGKGLWGSFLLLMNMAAYYDAFEGKDQKLKDEQKQ